MTMTQPEDTPTHENPIGDQFPGTYRTGWDDGRELGRREGWAAAYDRALSEWVEVSTADPYTVVQPTDRPPFVPSTPPGSGRHLVDRARKSWALVEAKIRA